MAMKSLVVLWLGLLCSSALAQQNQSTVYRIDGEQSRMHWLIYSAGALSRLGHNHTVSVANPIGEVRLGTPLSASSFEIVVAVESLVVDDPELRAGLGEEFSGVPSADDIEGTRRNMLSERLLDAEQHPTLRIGGFGPLGSDDNQTMNLTVEVAGNTAELVVPVTVRVDDDIVRAEGSFQLTHEQLGLRPFSALLGAIKVAEQMDFHYAIVARRAN